VKLTLLAVWGEPTEAVDVAATDIEAIFAKCRKLVGTCAVALPVTEPSEFFFQETDTLVISPPPASFVCISAALLVDPAAAAIVAESSAC